MINLPSKNFRISVNARGCEIQQYGIRFVRVEFEDTQGNLFHVWLKVKVCDVFHVYLSVPALRQQGHHASFGSDLNITFNAKEDRSYVTPFESASDHFFVRPRRIVNFDEVSQI